MKKFKIIIICFVSFAALVIAVIIKQNNIVSLGYLYLTSPREVIFNDMIIGHPYDYIKNCQIKGAQSKGFVLLKYPKSEVMLGFSKTGIINSDEFYNNYSYRLKKLNFSTIKKEKRRINNTVFYAVNAKKSNPSEYKEYAYIAKTKTVIEYYGNEKNHKVFWNILESIRFLSEKDRVSE